jgi:hypothetical protein
MLDRPNVSEPTKSAGDDREQPSAAVRTMAAEGEVSFSLRQDFSVTTKSQTSVPVREFASLPTRNPLEDF